MSEVLNHSEVEIFKNFIENIFGEHKKRIKGGFIDKGGLMMTITYY